VIRSANARSGSGLFLVVHAIGVQKYTCQANGTWLFTAPEAVLYKTTGMSKPIGTHFLNFAAERPVWQFKVGARRTVLRSSHSGAPAPRSAPHERMLTPQLGPIAPRPARPNLPVSIDHDQARLNSRRTPPPTTPRGALSTGKGGEFSTGADACGCHEAYEHVDALPGT
jgi:hypothetical protein